MQIVKTGFINNLLKYLFDRLLAFIALLILSPLLLMVAVGVKISSRGPVFFLQKRVGKDGRLFTIIKFRTMTANDGINTVTAVNDHRITKFGAFLRKWKIDELPELINILVGDMSFVGPRPDVPGYADLLKGNDRKILTLRPGITGPASLKYYNEEEILASVGNPKEYNDQVIFPDKVRINLKYLERSSLAEDLKIIFLTILRKHDDEY
ncbi:MAG: sugar transferase [Bacteroidetes bacterium]|nr:sugar transferase [Bacteroidota bacterium]